MIFLATIVGPPIFDNEMYFDVTVARKRVKGRPATGILDSLIHGKVCLEDSF